MPCSTCGKAKTVQPATKTNNPVGTPAVKNTTPKLTSTVPQMAGRSATSTLYRLRYMGGGMATKRKTGSGCRTCGGGKSTYSVVTKEEIMFVSEDAPNGIYKEVVSIGHDYLVTEEQKRLMLTMTYRDVAGKEKHKFQEVQDGASK